MNNESTEKKKATLNSFISLCEASDGGNIPTGYTYRDVSKVISERYPTQSVEVVKVFFRSKDRKTNNKPFTYPEELPVGTATTISNDLYDVRTTVGIAYGQIVEPTAMKEEYQPTEEELKLIEELS